MSSAAKFLLEFEARGDQEVVNKIKAVGQAGTEAATELQGLQGIEDPFAPIAEGADSAIQPITDVGTAAADTVTPITDLGTAATDTVSPLGEMGTATEDLGGIFSGAGTEADTFGGALSGMNDSAVASQGGLEDTNTLVGDFGDTAATTADQTSGFGSSVAGITGGIVAIGGAIGSAVGAFFRYQDAQNKVFKTQVTLQRGQEAYRKTTADIQKLLGTATSNIDGIAAANQRYVAAQDAVNRLLAAGVRSGAEYDAAVKELNDSQAALGEEFRKGGGDVSKLTALMNKAEIQANKNASTTDQLAKANRQASQALLEQVTTFATIGGSLTQMGATLSKVGGKSIPLLGTSVAGLVGPLAAGGAAVAAFLGTVLALTKVPYDQLLGKLDQLGVAIGTTLPAAKGPLQGFADASRDSMEFLAKGTTDLVKTLTGVDLESKIAGKSFSQLVEEFMKAGTVGVPTVDAALSAFIDKGKELGMSEQEIIALAKEHNAEFERTGKLAKGAATAHGLFAGSVMEANAALTANVQMSEAQAAALEKVTGSAQSTHMEVAIAADAIAGLTEADVKSISTLQQHTRELAIANAGYNNAKVATLQFEEALTNMTISMVNDTDQKNANARATLALANSNLNAQNTLATLRNEYANSVDKLADLNNIMGSADMSALKLAASLNEHKAALMEENMELDASIRATNDAANAKIELDNAYKRGILNIDEWGLSLATAAQEEQGAIDRLADFGHTFQQLPPFIEPTIENLKKFAEAAEMGGQAAVEAGQMALEAFADMTSTASKDLQGLIDVIREGGKDVEKNVQKWWEKIPEGVRENMSEAQQQIASGIATAMAAGQDAIDSFEWDLLTGMDLAGAASQLESEFRNIAGSIDGVMSDVFSRAADIAATGSDDMIQQMRAAFETGAVGQPLLNQLNTIFEQGKTDAASAGTAMGTNLTSRFAGTTSSRMQAAMAQAGTAVSGGGLQETAGQTGAGAGISLSQEFAAAGVHIAKVIEGIKANIASIGTAGAGLASGITIPVTVDVSQANTVLSQLVNYLSQLQGYSTVVTVTANVDQAANILTQLVNQLTTLQGYTTVVTVTANTSQAVSSLNAASTAALTMRNNFNVAASGATAAMARAGSAAASFASRATSSFNAAGRAALTARNNINQMSSGAKSALNAAGSAANRFASQFSSAMSKVKSQASSATSAVNKLRSAVNSLRSKSITIHVGISGPGVRYLQHGFHGVVNKPMLFVAGEAGPERVDVTPGGAAQRTDNNIIRNVHVTGGGARESVINVPVFLDGKLLTRVVRRHLAEDVTAGM